jgi:hypothetical protein
MPFNSLANSLLLWLSLAGLAHAEEPPVVTETDESPVVTETDESPVVIEADQNAVTEEIIVMGELEIARRRAQVIRNLKGMGYREGRTRNGRTVYKPDTAYHPTVVLDDDAWMLIKRTPVRMDPPGAKDNRLRYLWCVPPLTITPTCIQAGGQLISKRRLNHFKEDVVRSTRYEMREWQSAVVAHAMDKRLGEEIPDMLEELWGTGMPESKSSSILETAAERRAAILQFWSSRACVKEGEQARLVVADFMEYTVQTSENPASTDEIVKANKQQRCPDATLLELSIVP